MESDWENLPKHLLDSIIEKIVSLSDYLRFSLVCKAWYSVAKDNQVQRSERTSPMLLICAKKSHTWNIYSIADDKIFDLQLSVPNKRYCGSSFGWLVAVEKNFAITLINPFLRVKGRKKKENSIIRLPPMRFPQTDEQRRRWSRHCNYYVFKASMSADPITNAEDCIVVVIYMEFCKVAFIRLCKDTTWTYIDTNAGLGNNIYEVVTDVDDKIYALDHRCKLLSFGESNPNLELVACLTQKLAVSKKYLVYSAEKELLAVIRNFSYNNGRRLTIGFLVFRLNFDRREWVAKDDLGDDVALFVGDNSSITVLASKSGCLPNCIYFLHDYDSQGSFDRRYNFDYGVYNMVNGSISQPYSTTVRNFMDMSDYDPIWVKPTFNL